MNEKILGIITAVIFLSIGFTGGWLTNSIFTKDNSKTITNANPVSTEPLSICTGSSTESSSKIENYYQKFTIKGKIISIDNSEIQLSINNIDVPGVVNFGPNDSGKRKIIVNNQTGIFVQPENTLGDPAPIGGTNSDPSTVEYKEFKNISMEDLMKDDVIFVLTLEDVRKTNDLTAVKIIKERKNLMLSAPIAP